MISVCIATHNGDNYIKAQIDSILCQLSSDDEIVISDDGSTDNTLSILDAYHDHRIKIHLFKQPSKSRYPHVYVCRNFENALKYANGDFIFLSDQDDWWMPNKVSTCIDALQRHTLVVHQAYICDGQLQSKGLLMYKDKFVFKNYLALKRGKYYGCTIAFCKELLQDILPFPKDLVLHDQWIGCMAELTGNVFFEKDPLIKYRQHGNNTSGGKSKNSRWFQIYYRLYIFMCLISRYIKSFL